MSRVSIREHIDAKSSLEHIAPFISGDSVSPHIDYPIDTDAKYSIITRVEYGFVNSASVRLAPSENGVKISTLMSIKKKDIPKSLLNKQLNNYIIE